jgi:uncharacterized protein (DUF1330 family)
LAGGSQPIVEDDSGECLSGPRKRSGPSTRPTYTASAIQAKPPVYTVSEIQITNLDAYLKEFAPVAQASIKAAGGRFLAGGPGTSLEGAPPATRVTIQMWDSLEQAKAWRNGADYKKASEIGEYAKFRAIAVEGMPR